MNKYKNGEKVRIKNEYATYVDSCDFDYSGVETIIVGEGNGKYLLDVDGGICLWDECVLEAINNKENHEVFIEELNQISDEKLRSFVAEFLDTTVPKYFYHVPASSSGKYHPKQDLGEGGLVRHTKAVVRVALDLLRCEQFVGDTSENRDITITACLLHDTFKNGVEDSGYTVSEHPKLSGKFFFDKCESCYVSNYKEWGHKHSIFASIVTHMGIWNKDREGNEILPKPETNLQKLVHLADYIASRKYINFEDLQQGDK